MKTTTLTPSQHFKTLIKGTYSAYYLSMIFIAISVVILGFNFNNLLVSIPLLLSTLAIAIFVYKFSDLNKIKVNYTSAESIKENFTKFKTLTKMRKKYEGGILLFWFITLINTYASYTTVDTKFIIAAIFEIGLVVFFGSYLFKEVDKQINQLENNLNL